MSEIGRDAGRVVDRAGEITQQFGGELDKAYAAAKGFDWGAVVAVAAALIVVVVAIGVVQMCVDANRTPAKADPSHPTLGDPDYLDWANRTGKYAPQAKPPHAAQTPQ